MTAAPVSLCPDVCTAAGGEESLHVLKTGHAHCALRPVQHSKVGGAKPSFLLLLLRRHPHTSLSLTFSAPAPVSKSGHIFVHVCSCPVVAAAVGLSEARLAPILSVTIIRILCHSHRYKHSLLLSCRQREKGVPRSHHPPTQMSSSQSLKHHNTICL